MTLKYEVLEKSTKFLYKIGMYIILLKANTDYIFCGWNFKSLLHQVSISPILECLKLTGYFVTLKEFRAIKNAKRKQT